MNRRDILKTAVATTLFPLEVLNGSTPDPFEGIQVEYVDIDYHQKKHNSRFSIYFMKNKLMEYPGLQITIDNSHYAIPLSEKESRNQIELLTETLKYNLTTYRMIFIRNIHTKQIYNVLSFCREYDFPFSALK